MEPEGSSPHSQVPATCPYPEPARSSPYPYIPFPEDPAQYPSIYALVSQVVSFPQVSPPKPCIHLSSPPYVLHAPSISFLRNIITLQNQRALQHTPCSVTNVSNPPANTLHAVLPTSLTPQPRVAQYISLTFHCWLNQLFQRWELPSVRKRRSEMYGNSEGRAPPLP